MKIPTSTSAILIFCTLSLAPSSKSLADTVVVGTLKYQRTEQFLGTGDAYGNAQGNMNVLANGNFIISWDQGDPTDCYGQIFNQGGTNLGSAFLVDPNADGSWHYGPVVAAFPNGGFVASWGGGNNSSSEADGQIFNSAPSATGNQFTCISLNIWPVVDSFTNGDFIVAGLNPNPSDTPVYARRFNSSGVPYGSTFQVNVVTNGQGTASATYGTDGRFAIAWLSQLSGNNIMARAYYSNEFSPFGPEFPVNSSAPTTNYRSYPTVRYNASNELIVAWVGFGSTSADGVFARKFDANAVAEGPEWQVNQVATSINEVSLAVEPTNEMLFCWGSTNDMYGRLFDGSGNPVGNEFRFNQYTGSGSRYLGWNGGLHNNAVLANGNLALSWVGAGASGNGVYLTTLQFLDDAAITITSEPTNETVFPGSLAQFSVTATSAETLGYQWQLNGTNLTANARVSGVNTANLSISGAQPGDSGEYQVIITNSVLSVTSSPSALLSIIDVLPQIPGTNINEQVLWQYTPVVNGSGYTFGLSNAPSGMTVDPSAGTISWTPTQAQATYEFPNINYIVYLSGTAIASASFDVTVNDINVAPVLTVPGAQQVDAATTLTVTNTATESDIWATSLVFALVSAPAGVVINPNTGVLTWTPTPSQAPGTNTIIVSVTDFDPDAVNSPYLSVAGGFTVVVNPWNAQGQNIIPFMDDFTLTALLQSPEEINSGVTTIVPAASEYSITTKTLLAILAQDEFREGKYDSTSFPADSQLVLIAYPKNPAANYFVVENKSGQVLVDVSDIMQAQIYEPVINSYDKNNSTGLNNPLISDYIATVSFDDTGVGGTIKFNVQSLTKTTTKDKPLANGTYRETISLENSDGNGTGVINGNNAVIYLGKSTITGHGTFPIP